MIVLFCFISFQSILLFDPTRVATSNSLSSARQLHHHHHARIFDVFSSCLFSLTDHFTSSAFFHNNFIISRFYRIGPWRRLNRIGVQVCVSDWMQLHMWKIHKDVPSFASLSVIHALLLISYNKNRHRWVSCRWQTSISHGARVAYLYDDNEGAAVNSR